MAAALTDHVVINITRETNGVKLAGFGTPLLLSYSADWAERVRSYASLTDVVADFAAATPEYLAASAVFSQSPRVRTLKIGRMASAPTQSYVVGVTAAVNSTAYTISLASATVAEQAVEFTTDSSATNDEVVAGLVTQINLVVGKNFTAAATGTSGSQVCTVTADAAGDWFSLSAGERLTMTQGCASTGLADDLTAIADEDPDFYAVCPPFASNAYSAAGAAWCEAAKRLWVSTTADTNVIDQAVSVATDLADALADASYQCAVTIYHPHPVAFANAAWVGTGLPHYPGKATWKFRTLAGVTTYNLTATQRVNLRAKNCNFYEDQGVAITTDGVCANGYFVDDVRGLHWLEDLVQKKVFAALANALKVPYTDAGVAVIVAQVRGALGEAVQRGVLREGFTVTAPLVSDVSSTDKGNRHLPDVEWQAELAGAIHTVTVNGRVSL